MYIEACIPCRYVRTFIYIYSSIYTVAIMSK